MGTSRKRPSKINKIPSKRIKQPTYVFLRLITKVHQPCQRVENKCQRKQKGQSRIDNPQKLATLGTQNEHEHSKQHNTICVGYRYTQAKLAALCTQDTRRTQTQQITQHNMCWIPLYENKHK